MDQRTRGRRAVLVALVVIGSLLATSGRAVTAGEPTPYPGGTWEPPPAQYGVAVESTVLVPMDDGVALRAQVLRPTDPATGELAPGSFPVLITQTPYSASLAVTGNVPLCDDAVALPAPAGCSGGYFVQRGYIVVIADQRGTGLSGGGDWDVFGTRQGRDGARLAFWAAEELAQSNGAVGLFGCSALGISQLATAIELGRTHGTQHPVRAMVPGCISGGMYRDTYFDNGVPGLTVPLTAAEPVTAPHRSLLSLTEGRSPRLQAAEILTGGDLAYERAFWQERKWSDGGADIVRSGIPALVYVGWGEGGHIGGLELYAQLQNAYAGRNRFAPMARNQRVTGRYQLFIGDGGHGCCLADPAVQLQWFEQWLRGVDTGLAIDTPTPMHLQVLGDGGAYVNAATYPFTDRYTVLRLGAGTLGGSSLPGTDALVWAPPVDGVSSHGYDTAPYPSGATIAGPMSASIYASSTNSNLQLTAELFDVAPDGTAVPISHGTVVGSLATYDPARSWVDRNGNLTRPYALFDFDRPRLPGTVNRYDISIAPKLYRLAPGHHLRLTLATQFGADTCVGSGGVGPAPYACVHTAPQAASLAGGAYTIHRMPGSASALHLPLLPYDAFAPVASGPTPTSEGTVVPTDWG